MSRAGASAPPTARSALPTASAPPTARSALLTARAPSTTLFALLNAAALSTALLTACAPPTTLDLTAPTLPSGDHFVGAILRSGEGTALSSTGLAPIGADAPSYIFPSNSSAAAFIDLYAFPAADIAALRGAVSLDELLTGSIREATPQEPILSPLSYYARYTADGAASSNPPPAPALTAPWLPACPSAFSSTTVDIDLSCARGGCAAGLELSGCRGTLNLNPVCGLQPFEVTIGARGEVRAEGDAALKSCAAAPAEPDSFAHTICQDSGQDECHLRFYSRREPVLRSLTSVSVGPAARSLRLDRPIVGAVSSMALLPDRVVVTQPAEFPIFWADCRETAPTKLTFVDRATLQTSTATAPPCLLKVGVDPSGDGFLGAYGAEIGRFDRRGHLLASVRVGAPITAQHRPIAYVRAMGSSQAGFVYAVDDILPLPHDSFVALVDPRTMALSVSQGASGSSLGQGTVAGGAIAVTGTGLGGEEKDKLYELSASGEVLDRGSLRACSEGADVSPPEVLGLAAHTVVAVTGNVASAIFVMPGTELARCARANFYAFNADATALAAVPRRETLALVAVTDASDPERERTALGVLDASAPRFLPKISALPPGAITSLVVPGDGTVWMLQPWTGSVLVGELDSSLAGP